MPTALLIPVKTMGNAKQRLGDAFDQYHRTLLAEAMLRDVLTAVSGVADRVEVFLVTGDPQAQSLATQFKLASSKTVATKARQPPSKWRAGGAKIAATTPRL